VLIARVETAEGVVAVDLDDETIVAVDALGTLEREEPPTLTLPRVVTAAARGSTIVALVDAKPPLLVSHDAGRTWRDSGRGLPAGRTVAVGDDNPDLILYATDERLYLSRDGGRFWRALAVELNGIAALEL
jgi:hypothetical protein